MPSYAHITSPTSPRSYRGGYDDTFRFCPTADFTSIAAPTGTPTTLGDKVKITAAHTFTGTAGFYEYAAQKRTITHTSETVGDFGAQLLKHTFVVKILGDAATTLEQLQNILNSNVIVLLKDAKCDATEYVQFGDSCIQPTFKVAFDGSNPDGSKVYTITGEVTDAKYYYSGAYVKSTA